MRSLGISLRPDGFSFALCDGSLKKYSVAASGEGLLPSDSSDPVRDLGKALASALKNEGAGKYDRVVIAAPGSTSPLRELSLPFSDREKIMQVLKFEVESELYHLDIEDVVCDYMELQDERATTTLLVASQPKTDIQLTLDVLSNAGIDAPLLDLDYGALASYVPSIPTVGSVDGLDDELSLAERADLLHGVLHVGPYSSILIVFSERGVRAVRELHVGYRELGRGQAHEGPPEVHGEPVVEGRDENDLHAAESAEAAAHDAIDELMEDQGEEAAEEGHDSLWGSDPSLPTGLTAAQLYADADPAELQELRQRVIAELRRGLIASSLSLQSLTLAGAVMPGLDESMQARLGLPVRLLEAEDQACPIAVGAALRGLGDKASVMNFRQEEFRFTRGLERVEGPLTFALVSLIAYFVLAGVVDYKVGSAKMNAAAGLGDRNSLLTLTAHEVDQLLNENLPEGAPDDWRVRTNFEGVDMPRKQHIERLRIGVNQAADQLDEMLGTSEDIEMPQSCLNAWRLVSDVLARELDGRASRWMLEDLQLTSFDKRGNRTDAHVEVKMTVSIFGDQATALGEGLQTTLRNQPWRIEQVDNNGWEPLPNADGRFSTITVRVDTTKAADAEGQS
jgi:Tfp pilus assembly PilM family ATPase